MTETPGPGARDLRPGDCFPDLGLADYDGHPRRLSDVAGDDPLLHTYRGWWCPKERAFLCRLATLQDEAEVGYTRFVSRSVEPPATSAAFRAGLDARWPFLADPDRSTVSALGLRETTDTVHDPYLPTVWLLGPDLRMHRWWLGCWHWARPTLDELRVGLREISAGLRTDRIPPRPEPGPRAPGSRCSTARAAISPPRPATTSSSPGSIPRIARTRRPGGWTAGYWTAGPKRG